MYGSIEQGSRIASGMGRVRAVRGFGAGATDGAGKRLVHLGKLSVDLDARRVDVDGVPVHPTGKEYAMLELLALNQGRTVTKEMFLNHLYGGINEPELKIIDVFICKLRKKLAQASGADTYIETVWGRGYVLREPDEASAAA